MTPAEKRIKELIDRWLTSIELHLQYASLSDAEYWKIQSWPKHDRPTRWVLESAKQKAHELKEVFESRHLMGDSRFADALELMSFLANLVGAQHVDRFVPLAEPKGADVMPATPPSAVAPPKDAVVVPVAPSRPVTTAPPTSDVPSWYMQAHAAQTKPAPAPPKPAVAPIPTVAEPKRAPPNRGDLDPDATREMPKPVAKRIVNESEATREMPKLRAQSAPPPSAPKTEPRKSASQKSGPATRPVASKTSNASSDTQETVVADAIRLLGWGRTWHELAELIARMADRPPLAEVRKILRANRSTIEKQAKEQKT